MNKYWWLLILIVVLVGGAIVVSRFTSSGAGEVSGIIREITITVAKDEWRFVPDEIEVNQGDKVILTIINEDGFDHGIAIDAFGVNQRIPANGTIRATFVATRLGSYPFYCSVPCGEGEVDGEKRGHFDQTGKIHVRSAAAVE